MLMIIAMAVSACGATTPILARIERGEASPSEMYEFASDLKDGTIDLPARGERNGERLINRYDWAAYIFDQIERYYPGSHYAALGQLQQGETYYKEKDYDKAVPELEEFIRENPGHHLLDRAYYLSAMSAFVQISTEGLDPGDTRSSVARFERLLRDRPGSPYEAEAKERIAAAKTQLAATEIRLGLSLQRQKNFEGAVARYLRVVNEFETTPYIEEALYRLVESYLSLGIRTEAETYAKLLGSNYPNGEWYARAYGLLTGNPLPASPVQGFLSGLLQ